MKPDLINIARTPEITLLYCGRALLDKFWNAENVRVPYWRLYWNNRPGAELRPPDAGRPHDLAPNYFFLIAPNTALSRVLLRPVEHFFTHFTVGAPYDRMQDCAHRFGAPPALVRAMRRDYTPTRIESPAEDLPRRSATALALCWFALSTLPAEKLPAAPANPRLSQLLAWWETRGWQALSNRELAGRVAMHPTAFCRYFHRAMGMPPQAYGVNKRMERACLLLHFSDRAIAQIAEDTGFCDRYYFSRQFRKMRGVSPARFRRQFALADK